MSAHKKEHTNRRQRPIARAHIRKDNAIAYTHCCILVDGITIIGSIAQIANITWPGMPCELLDFLRSEGNRFPIVLSTDLLGKVLHQNRNVLFAFPKWRQ